MLDSYTFAPTSCSFTGRCDSKKRHLNCRTRQYESKSCVELTYLDFLCHQRYSVMGTYDQPIKDFHAAIDDFYQECGKEDQFGQLHQRLKSCIDKLVKKVKTRIKNLEEALVEAQGYAETQRRADLIMANMHL